jgi:hypothetical protein
MYSGHRCAFRWQRRSLSGEGDGLREVATEPGALIEFAHFIILVGGWDCEERGRKGWWWELGGIYSGVVDGREVWR